MGLLLGSGVLLYRVVLRARIDPGYLSKLSREWCRYGGYAKSG